MSLKEDINFSLWCDFIERDFLENRFQDMINDNIIQGATSNPAIFESSISNSVAYKQQLQMLQANNAKTIYEELALMDIGRAAVLLNPLHLDNSDDGFISIEVDPLLCDDKEGTIKEGERIYKQLGKDNVMIKIPATQAGYGAMRDLTSKGINVNATLVFSPHQAIECVKALDEGIKESNKDVKAVISVFVSRFDRLMDEKLVAKGLEKNKLGIINAIKCYYLIQNMGNKNIRTLFASTGVKGEDLSPSYYVNNLIYPNSVNTAPLGTIDEWLNHGIKEPTVMITEDDCNEYFELLKENGIIIENIYTRLLDEGLEAFKQSFSDLLEKLKI